MQEVKIYDFDFNLLASDFKCISFDWDVRFNSIGTFEGVFAASSPIYEACRQKEFTVCVQGENQGIITSVKVKDDRIVISGRGMNYILEKRICMPFSTYDQGVQFTEAEMVCEIVKNACGDFMEVLSAPAIGNKRHFMRFKARSVFETVSNILRSVNAGHFVKFDTKNSKWVFGITPANYNALVLSKPDNTLEDCDYVRNISDFASCGVYKQKMKFMGQWRADTNNPSLSDNNPDNFAKAYLISESGTQFGKNFTKGNYVLCMDLSGKLTEDVKYEDFWFKATVSGKKGAYLWESILECEDIKAAEEQVLLKEIDENVTAITRGVNQKELLPGDVVEIRLAGGKNAAVFTKQVKKVLYHYEWGNCYIKPVFFKLKEDENG